MKIDKKFFEQLTGSLSKEKIDNEKPEFGNLFKIINSINPHDNKIDVEEITKFAASIWQEDDGDGKISDDEIESYIQKNQSDFKNTGLKAKDIRKFLEFFVKNSDNTTNDIRIDNADGTYSVITEREEYREEKNITNQREIDSWEREHNKSKSQNTNQLQDTFNKSTDKAKPKERLDSLFNRSNSISSETKPKPKPKYKTTLVSNGTVKRKINYNSNNQIVTIEETRGNVTTITDTSGKIIQTITKNEGAKDTIIDFITKEDGSTEQSYFYGKNGVKDSPYPTYKNVYKNNQLVSKYEYDSSGNIISRQDYQGGVVSSVTKYANGVEVETVNLHTNGIYNYADAVGDGVIDPVEQHLTGDCYLLNSLSTLQDTSWGRDALNNCIKRDVPNKGDYTITFQKAFGEQKEFVITKADLEQAKKEQVDMYTFGVSKGDKIYIDGKLELTISNQDSFTFNMNDVKQNITFVNMNGQKNVWTLEDIKNYAIDGLERGEKYSSGDLDTLAFEVAYERNRAQAELPLRSGNEHEVYTCILGENYTCEVYKNARLIKSNNKGIDNSKTQSRKSEDIRYDNALNRLSKGVTIKYNDILNNENILQKLLYYKDNFDKFANNITIAMDGEGYHAGKIKRFEEQDGKTYVVYTHTWDNAAEIQEEITEFVNKLAEIILASPNQVQISETNADGKFGEFQSSDKRNLSNITSSFSAYISAYGRDAIDKMITKDESGNITIKFPNEQPVTISAKDIATAVASGNYAKKDDDVTAFEVAIERVLNNKKHYNTLYELEHTDLADFSQEEILSLLTGKDYSLDKVDRVGVNKKLSTDNYIITGFDRTTKQQVAVKRVETMPDGTKQFVITSSENSGVEIRYTESEFNNFGPLTLYKK